MIVSWNWLKEYTDIDLPREEVENRLTMSGLNHEGTETVGDDFAIDLEVTSNRPDCLGHIGVAREISVLLENELRVNDPSPKETGTAVGDSLNVRIDDTELCSRYTARVIRGVKIGPSPDWLVQRLASIGMPSVNNVVDVTNFVMMECGQPLHAFDLAKVDGGISVRRAKPDEEIEAIDHRTYQLDTQMCVIADESRAVAIAGVMGGAETEVTDSTTDLLIESAEFSQLAVRYAARKLILQSPSSYRFERTVDPRGVDWASRRCCELILEVAGGELASGCIDEGQSSPMRASVALRHAQIKRVLGIEIDAKLVEKILADLGCEIVGNLATQIDVVPPSWRRDLAREVDLIEEVARIHGYDQIPEDAAVPMAATVLKDEDRAIDKVRQTLVAAGYYEAMTTTLIPKVWSDAFSPWSSNEPLVASQTMQGVVDTAWQNVGRVDLARRSLVPSLLEARRVNEHRSNSDARLFEIAKVYLGNGDELPTEEWKLTIVTGDDFFGLKGVLKSMLARLSPAASIKVDEFEHELFDRNRCAGLLLGDKRLGWIGEVSESTQSLFTLRNNATVCEIDLQTLIENAVLIPQQSNISEFPAISRDFNFILSESIHWDGLADSVRNAGGDLVESVRYVETFRNADKDGEDRKRLLLSVTLRSDSETLTGDVAEKVCANIIEQCGRDHQAVLVS